MVTLRCKECGDEYEGDETAAWLCDPCYETLVERGVPDEDILEDYAPTEEELDALEIEQP